MTARTTFRQADISRALKAAKAADVKVVVEIAPDGTLRLIPVDDGERVGSGRPLTPMEARRRRLGKA